jgi:hypothetical protein
MYKKELLAYLNSGISLEREIYTLERLRDDLENQRIQNFYVRRLSERSDDLW